MSRRYKCAIIIPARYQSERFAGKALALLSRLPVVQRVYATAQEVSARTWVATDDERIAEAIERIGGSAIVTDIDYDNGSERVLDASLYLQEQGLNCDYIINLQADEPLVTAADIRLLIKEMDASGADIGTLATPCRSLAEAKDPNTVKVVPDFNGYAAYFSRALVPFYHGKRSIIKPHASDYFKHVGVYAFREEIVPPLLALPPAPLEQLEGLEQLRWTTAGYPIRLVLTDTNVVGINTPADLLLAERELRRRQRQQRKHKPQ